MLAGAGPSREEFACKTVEDQRSTVMEEEGWIMDVQATYVRQEAVGFL